jgi:hypothetical protein
VTAWGARPSELPFGSRSSCRLPLFDFQTSGTASGVATNGCGLWRGATGLELANVGHGTRRSRVVFVSPLQGDLAVGRIGYPRRRLGLSCSAPLGQGAGTPRRWFG